MSNKTDTLNNSLTLIFVFIFLVPVVFIFLNIFSESSEVWLHIQTYLLQDYVMNSLIIVIFVAAFTVIIGTSLAWIVSMYEFPGVNIFKWLLILPMAIPTYVNGYIYSGLNETSGLLFNVMDYYFGLGPYVYNLYDIQNIYGVIFIMTISLYPYVYLLCLPAFANHSYSVFEVGKSLGLNTYQRLTKIALPIVRPAVVAGVSFVIMETLAEYATMEYFGVPTFATGIFRAWFVLGDEVSSFRLSSILLTLVFFLIYFEEMSRGKRKFDNPTNKIYERKKEVPKNKTQLVILCSLIVFFGSILQFFQIFYWISYSLERLNILFIFELITSSASIALIGAIVIVLFTLNIAFISRVTKNIFTRLSIKIFSLGYAIPGVVLAVGIITPTSYMEKAISSVLDYPPENLLSGTFFLLLIAYLVRFSTISIKTIDSGFNKISSSYDLLASSFGYSKLQALIRVHLPILLPTISSATILLFVDIVKELPMTLILRPFNFNTLPVHLYELAEAENLSSIGVPGLILIIICLIPVIILSKGIIKNVRH
ncbi:MAG: iron(III) ABC transporter permease [Ectothiorhodospiraceae bacterium]|nr:MAG: iron(III) ABC transporter permease [Ectothiorhodospiraceae bacterium]